MTQFIIFSIILFILFVFFALWLWNNLNESEPTTIEPMKTRTIQSDDSTNFNEWAIFIHNQNKKQCN